MNSIMPPPRNKGPNNSDLHITWPMISYIVAACTSWLPAPGWLACLRFFPVCPDCPIHFARISFGECGKRRRWTKGKGPIRSRKMLSNTYSILWNANTKYLFFGLTVKCLALKKKSKEKPHSENREKHLDFRKWIFVGGRRVQYQLSAARHTFYCERIQMNTSGNGNVQVGMGPMGGWFEYCKIIGFRSFRCVEKWLVLVLAFWGRPVVASGNDEIRWKLVCILMLTRAYWFFGRRNMVFYLTGNKILSSNTYMLIIYI